MNFVFRKIIARSIARAIIFSVALWILQDFVGKTCGLFYKSLAELPASPGKSFCGIVRNLF